MIDVVVPFHQDQRLPPQDLPDLGGTPAVVVPELPPGDLWRRLCVLYDQVADAVGTAAADPARRRPTVVLSGDCVVASAVLTGLQRAELDPAVVWFDAHGDVHTLETSTSGYPGGMALRLVTGAHSELLAGPLGLQPLTDDRAVLVDARDLDPAEAELLARGTLRRLTVEEVSPDRLPAGPLLLHVDVDVVDRAELPGLRFPAEGGPTARSVLAAVDRVVSSGRVVALDIACPWLPTDDEARRASRTALVSALAGAAG